METELKLTVAQLQQELEDHKQQHNQVRDHLQKEHAMAIWSLDKSNSYANDLQAKIEELDAQNQVMSSKLMCILQCCASYAKWYASITSIMI